MTNLQISLETAKKLYPTASKEFKTMLEETFGKKLLSKITDRIKIWDDVARELGIAPVGDLPFPHADTEIQEWLNDVYKLDCLNLVLNEGWVPDWSNKDEYKYYPYFDCSGGGFVFYGYLCTYTFTNVGGRLVFRSSELATYAGKQFSDLYKRVQTRK